jgi:hypothetical protein
MTYRIDFNDHRQSQVETAFQVEGESQVQFLKRKASLVNSSNDIRLMFKELIDLIFESKSETSE